MSTSPESIICPALTEAGVIKFLHALLRQHAFNGLYSIKGEFFISDRAPDPTGIKTSFDMGICMDQKTGEGHITTSITKETNTFTVESFKPTSP